jgi:hypothetical protein
VICRHLSILVLTSLSILYIFSIYADGGLKSFWRGNFASVLETVPSAATVFYTFEIYKGTARDRHYTPLTRNHI